MEGRDEPTSMLEALLERFGLASSEGFIRLAYRSFDKAAREPAALALSVYRRVEDRIEHRAIPSWHGLFEHAPDLRPATASRIAAERPLLAVADPAGGAAAGACALALEALNA